MLINGVEADTDMDGLLVQVASLESSFPHIISQKRELRIPDDINYRLYQANQQGPREALGIYTESLRLIHERFPPEETLNSPSIGLLQTSLGSINTYLGNNEEAAEFYGKAIDTYIRAEKYFEAENTSKSLAELHKKNGTLLEYEKSTQSALASGLESGDQKQQLRARLELGAINRVSGKHEQAISHYSEAYDLQQGPVDYSASRVEQHEVGFSADKKIGTDNIQQCVAVILHDPETKKAALAHVDIHTDISSLRDVIANFPPEAKLNAYLVGGRDRSDQGRVISDNNISRVLGELSHHSNVDIKSADIGGRVAPAGIIFDPKTGKLTHGVPGEIDKTTPLRKLTLGPGPLRFAFDFTKSSEIAPPISRKQDIDAFLRVSYANVPKTGPLMGSTEAWTANILSYPLSQIEREQTKARGDIEQKTGILSFFNKAAKYLESKFGRKQAQVEKAAEKQIRELAEQKVEKSVAHKPETKKLVTLFQRTALSNTTYYQSGKAVIKRGKEREI